MHGQIQESTQTKLKKNRCRIKRVFAKFFEMVYTCGEQAKKITIVGIEPSRL